MKFDKEIGRLISALNQVENIALVVELSGVPRTTIIDIREGRVASPRYKTVRALQSALDRIGGMK